MHCMHRKDTHPKKPNTPKRPASSSPKRKKGASSKRQKDSSLTQYSTPTPQRQNSSPVTPAIRVQAAKPTKETLQAKSTSLPAKSQITHPKKGQCDFFFKSNDTKEHLTRLPRSLLLPPLLLLLCVVGLQAQALPDFLAVLQDDLPMPPPKKRNFVQVLTKTHTCSINLVAPLMQERMKDMDSVTCGFKHLVHLCLHCYPRREFSPLDLAAFSSNQTITMIPVHAVGCRCPKARVSRTWTQRRISSCHTRLLTTCRGVCLCVHVPKRVYACSCVVLAYAQAYVRMYAYRLRAQEFACSIA